MTDSECEHIQNLAKKNGLRESVAGFEEQAYKGEIEDALKQSGKENYIKILNASRVPNFPSQPRKISRYKKTLIFNLNVEHNLMTYLMPTGLDTEFIQARHTFNITIYNYYIQVLDLIFLRGKKNRGSFEEPERTIYLHLIK